MMRNISGPPYSTDETGNSSTSDASQLAGSLGPNNSSTSDASQLAVHGLRKAPPPVRPKKAPPPVRPMLLALPSDDTSFKAPPPLPPNIPFRRFPFDCVIDMSDRSTWPIIYKGREYVSMAARCPVFIPSPESLVYQPIWTQCWCVDGCLRCVYNGEIVCPGCDSRPRSSPLCPGCEPGCCAIPVESSGSSEDDSTTTGGASMCSVAMSYLQ